MIFENRKNINLSQILEEKNGEKGSGIKPFKHFINMNVS